MDRRLEKRLSDRAVAIGREGTVVQSQGERRIAEWLTTHGIACRYDAKFRIVSEFQIRPDFYLPELEVYIEYWGLDTPQYKMSMYKKQMLYQQEGKRLISIFPRDLPGLEGLLAAKMRLFGFHPGADARSEVRCGGEGHLAGSKGMCEGGSLGQSREGGRDEDGLDGSSVGVGVGVVGGG